MKVKTSVSLSSELIATIDNLLDAPQNRSHFLETAAWAYLARNRRRHRDNQDLDIIDRHATQLNEEASDTLAYQVEL